MKLDYGLVVTAPPIAPLYLSVRTRSHSVDTEVQKVLKSGIFFKDMMYLRELYLHVRVF